MKKVTEKERIKIIDDLNLILDQKIRLNNTYTFLIKNRVNYETRKKFKTVRNILELVYNKRRDNFLSTTI